MQIRANPTDLLFNYKRSSETRGKSFFDLTSKVQLLRNQQLAKNQVGIQVHNYFLSSNR